MSTYYINEAAFDVLDVATTDRSINLLELEAPSGNSISLVVQRFTLVEGLSLRDTANAHVRRAGLNHPGYKILLDREILVGGAPAIEIVSRYRGDEGIVVSREAHVLAGDLRLFISATAPYEDEAACEEHMERVLSSLRFRGGD